MSECNSIHLYKCLENTNCMYNCTRVLTARIIKIINIVIFSIVYYTNILKIIYNCGNKPVEILLQKLLIFRIKKPQQFYL